MTGDKPVVRVYSGPIPDNVDEEPGDPLLEVPLSDPDFDAPGSDKMEEALCDFAVEVFKQREETMSEETLHGTGAENRKVDQSNVTKLDGVCILLDGAEVMLREVLAKTDPREAAKIKWALHEVDKAANMAKDAADFAQARSMLSKDEREVHV